jgi:hypothetical protein
VQNKLQATEAEAEKHKKAAAKAAADLRVARCL